MHLPESDVERRFDKMINVLGGFLKRAVRRQCLVNVSRVSSSNGLRQSDGSAVHSLVQRSPVPLAIHPPRITRVNVMRN